MNYIKLLITAAVLGFTSMGCAKDQYNVLLFTADDLHAESLESYGSHVKGLTPHLDKFAESGCLFENAHVNAAICAPSRAIIATGLYGHNSGALGFSKANDRTPTIVSVLQSAGFNCGILGKVDHSTPVEGTKWDYCFDREELGDGRSPTLYYQRSKTFFEKCKKESKPFYFMVNSHDPHRPFCNPKKLRTGAEMPSQTYKPEEVEVPGFVPDLPGVREELAMYQNSTRRLDDTFGKVLQALDESGYADKTLVVFMSDNGIAIPFAKCNTWFHSTRTPMVFRLPGLATVGKRDSTHFISGIDLMPTFLDLLNVPGPVKQEGRTVIPLIKGESQAGRDTVFTQIDTRHGGDAVPMRCVQNKQFGYIYNPFSDGKHRYRNSNEGLCMKAMNSAAKDDPSMAARIDLFRYRVPEEFYDLEKDSNCLVNLIDSPEYRPMIAKMKEKLESYMIKTNDPMLEAFRNSDDRTIVDKVIRDMYGNTNANKSRKRK